MSFHRDDVREALEELRNLQNSGVYGVPYGKSPTLPYGSRVSPMAPLAFQGPPGNAPPAAYRPQGVTQTRPRTGWSFDPYGSGPTIYDSERTQPPPVITDINPASNAYSPFQPVWPYGPPYINRPRDWDYPAGYNLAYVPRRFQLYKMLRGMRQSWGVLATVVATRQDQLLRLPWTIQLRDKPRGRNKYTDELRKFFRRPDGVHSYGSWARLILFDVFDIDAASLYVGNRDRGGRPLTVEPLDGATIFPLIDDAGRRPESVLGDGEYSKRQPAYQQIIKGLPMVDMDSTELIYAPMRPRPEMPIFGYSPSEQFMMEATEGILKTIYNTDFWKEGNIPELMITVPETWTPNQIAMYQGHFDALLSGQLDLKSKMRFVPGGMKPFDIKNASGQGMWSERDEYLIRLCCFAHSVNPAPFIRQTNRATARTAQEQAQEEGLFPLMYYWKEDIMDVIIRDKFGYDDQEFTFLPRSEVDLLKQAQIHQIYLREGTLSQDEVREELGREPLGDKAGGDEHLIFTGTGAVRLKDVADGSLLPPPVGGGSAIPSGPGTKGRDGIAPTSSTKKPNPNPNIKMEKSVSWHDVREAAKEIDDDPTHAQHHTGNYRKGHIRIQGLDITIENDKGSMRGEKPLDGIKRPVKMPTAYGYIRGYIGADHMHIDVYIGKHPESPIVYVIDQDKVDSVTGANSGFDEHKVMLGYHKPQRAIKDYTKSHFDGRGKERLNAIVALTMKEFKNWLDTGDPTKPIADQNVGTPLEKKMDTISTQTGLEWYDQGRRKKKKNKSNSYQFPIDKPRAEPAQ